MGCESSGGGRGGIKDNITGGNFKRFYGKHRGVVRNNIDLECLGRVQCEVPAVWGGTFAWCMPCVPYAGPQVGFYMIPPIGANVWVEFEGGDPNYPIWAGCFWGPLETPLGTEPLSMTPMPPHPSQKVIKTEFTTIVLSDDPAVGGFYINATDEAVPVPVTIVGNAVGLRLDATPIDGEPMTRMTMVTEEGITLFYTEGTIAMTAAAIETNIGATTMIYTDGSTTLTSPEINATAEAAIEISAGADLSLTAGGAAELSGGGDVSVEAGGATEVSAAGDVSIEALGAVEASALGELAIEALANISVSAITMDINGVVEVDGDLLIDGLQPLCL